MAPISQEPLKPLTPELPPAGQSVVFKLMLILSWSSSTVIVPLPTPLGKRVTVPPVILQTGIVTLGVIVYAHAVLVPVFAMSKEIVALESQLPSVAIPVPAVIWTHSGSFGIPRFNCNS